MQTSLSVNELASRHLGQKGGEGYKDQYDPSLLVAIPRSLNRQAYGIDLEKNESPLFVGVDVWNAYEVSALTATGYPVTGILKIVYPADSPFHVESKSLKLYLNSFNMTKMSESAYDVAVQIRETVKKDLETILQCEVTVSFFSNDNSFTEEDLSDAIFFPRIQSLVPHLDEIEYNTYHSDESQLTGTGKSGEVYVNVDFLRSNCRVTHQPDWGELNIYIKSKNLPDLTSIAKYVISHRTVSHFHEEIVEMVYKHFYDKFQPEELLVCALYTRRGGIDINPCRASHEKLIPLIFKHPKYKIKKTLMQ